jgi:hypothetical protein
MTLQLRRALTGLAVMAFTVLALAGRASAGSAQVTQFHLHGTFANALWVNDSPTRFTETILGASKLTEGSDMGGDQFTLFLDPNGGFTGATETKFHVTSGFSFTISQPLASASVSGSGLPATTCTYDANINLIGCSDTTIDVAAEWTGQGPISRSVFNEHFKSDGTSVTDHFNGTFRDATATGTFAGFPLSAEDLQFANLDTATTGRITVCIGTSC